MFLLIPRLQLQPQPVPRLGNNQLSLAQNLLARHSHQDLIRPLFALKLVLNLVPETGGVLVNGNVHLLLLARLQVYFFESLQLLCRAMRQGVGGGNVQLQDLCTGNLAGVLDPDYCHAGLVRPERLGHRLDDGI